MLHYQPLEQLISAAPFGSWSPARRGARTRLLSRLWTEALSVTMLAVSDLLAMLTAFAAGFFCWVRPVLHQSLDQYAGALPFLGLFTAFFAAAGLYPGFGLGAVRTLRQMSRATAMSFIALAAVSFLLKQGNEFSRAAFGIAWLASLITVPVFRYLLLGAVSGLRWWGQPSLIVGTRPQVEMTIRSLKRAFSLGYRVIGFICIDDSHPAGSIEGIAQLGGLEMAAEIAEMGITTVLAWDSPELLKVVDTLQSHFRTVVIVRDERILPIEHIRVRNLGGVLGIEFTNELLRRGNQIIKRGIDIVAAVILLVLGAPLIALGSLAVKLASPGATFYAQQRRGLHERTFQVWKLRTMYPDAEVRLREYLQQPALRHEWETTMKLSHDPRIIPRVGHVLRRFSIDELPQLWAVLHGDMSLVGPRPFPDYHLSKFAPDFREFRARIRPGITGMWQVMIRSSGNLEHQEMFDTYYIRNWSLWLDLYILARTVFAVLAASGAS
jgi:Undecaprenyl-phosphate galactose phosphotransferase WbaP